MDWSKAKNILIVAFIITNLLLGYVLIDNRDIDNPASTLEEEFVNDVVRLLSEKGIKIDGEIPKDLPSLALMTVEYELYDAESLAGKFFDDYSIEEKDNSVHFNNGIESLIINSSKNIVYENYNTNKKYDKLDNDTVKDIVKDFLYSKGFNTNDYEITSIRNESGTFFIELTKTYKDMLIEKSYMKFEIDLTGIKRFERLWLNMVEMNESDISVSSAPRALLRLLTIEDAYDKSIIDISLAYYFDPEKHATAGNPQDTKQGKATPAWRVSFSDGTKIFLEEY